MEEVGWRGESEDRWGCKYKQRQAILLTSKLGKAAGNQGLSVASRKGKEMDSHWWSIETWKRKCWRGLASARSVKSTVLWCMFYAAARVIFLKCQADCVPNPKPQKLFFIVPGSSLWWPATPPPQVLSALVPPYILLWIYLLWWWCCLGYSYPRYLSKVLLSPLQPRSPLWLLLHESPSPPLGYLVSYTDLSVHCTCYTRLSVYSSTSPNRLGVSWRQFCVYYSFLCF